MTSADTAMVFAIDDDVFRLILDLSAMRSLRLGTRWRSRLP